MARPKKITQHCRKICLARFQQQSVDSDSTLTGDQNEEYDDIEMIDDSFGFNTGMRKFEGLLENHIVIWTHTACVDRMAIH